MCAFWYEPAKVLAFLLPPLLAFSLLFAQAVIPWTVSWFATQDGPSHVYNDVVITDLLLHHGHTHFSSVYQINGRIMPNWSATILLAIIEPIAGVDYTEKVMASARGMVRINLRQEPQLPGAAGAVTARTGEPGTAPRHVLPLPSTLAMLRERTRWAASLHPRVPL
jgi:hypothetical protein